MLCVKPHFPPLDVNVMPRGLRAWRDLSLLRSRRGGASRCPPTPSSCKESGREAVGGTLWGVACPWSAQALRSGGAAGRAGRREAAGQAGRQRKRGRVSGRSPPRLSRPPRLLNQVMPGRPPPADPWSRRAQERGPGPLASGRPTPWVSWRMGACPPGPFQWADRSPQGACTRLQGWAALASLL